ncbi:E-selectin isoform X1 [Fundulus heteroclitus]|uniref:E-selectin isoform X1 n=1 Tax=Fundulus heteroclitus TaxID=8078 RepID=UPI00165B3ED6|nr:E-selectin isoform X1 [Fundulus heteroclitus]
MSASSLQLVFFCSMLCLWTSVEGWSYHYSDEVMDWESARKWCRTNYTDMVAIQNQEEIGHLKSSLPRKSGYYWIGIRKVNDVWTWVGTNKPLTAEASNWATNEPNNGQKGQLSGQPEDCVEMYIKRETDEGKWNDERCTKRKTALCYTAACKTDSCLHGECVETINSHVCKCNPGFYGNRCEQVVQCNKEEVIRPQKGGVECTHDYGNFSYDSLCHYSCEEGYKLSVSEPQRCLATGNWSMQSPKCELVQCQDLSAPARGSMNCSDPLGKFSYRSSCEFTCKEGYKLDESSSRTVKCESSGKWSAPKPSCVAVQCPSLQNPDNGYITCEDDANLSFSYGKSCSFRCVPGYRLVGPSTLTCTAAAEWSEQAPHCEAITCQNPGTGDHLILQCSKSLQSNSTCNFSCEPGYELQGEQSIQCLEDGKWSDAKPSCKAVQCSALKDPSNGFITCEDMRFSYSKSCSFKCAPGYRLVGPSTLTCTAAAEWSEQAPHCEAITCQNPGTGDHLILQCSKSLQSNSTCNFSCEPGYKLQGEQSIQCLEDGKWSDAKPSCKAIQCSVLKDPGNGFITCEDMRFSYSKSCSFKCAPGYRLVGPSTLTCTAAAEWSEQAPHCEAITCQNPGTGDHLILQCSKLLQSNSTCNFSCEPGYELQGEQSIQCLEDGKWSDAKPSCKAVQCSALKDPSNGFITCEDMRFSYSKSCSFKCAPGYRLVGPSTLTCTAAAEWSEQAPHCEAITCQNPVEGANMIADCSKPLTDLRPSSTCSFSCEPGFELLGANTTTCSQDGHWSEATPTCSAVRCLLLDAPENGHVNCSERQPVFNSQCSFTCNQDFSLDGHEILTCDRHGSWTGKKPTCQAPSASSTVVASGMAAGGTALASGMALTMWILKRMKQKASKFELNSSSDLEEPLQVYKNSVDSLI